MATKEKSNDYRDAKDAFDTLELEDKAIFLMDAVFSTLLGGIEDVSSVVTDAVDDLMNKRGCDPDSDVSDADGTENARKTATKKTAAKKTAAKKATAKGTNSRKRPAAKKSTRTQKKSPDKDTDD